jgi:hypothetical protein
MPDIFVAPDEKKDVRMHQRKPLPSSPVNQPASAPITQPIQASPPANTPPTAPTQSPMQTNIVSQSTSSSLNPSSHTYIPLFTAFWQNPRGVYFDTQEANEHILLFLRQHFVTNVPWIFFTIIFLCIPPVLGYIFNLIHYTIPLIPIHFTSAILGFYYLLVATSAFTHFITWYYNISLITARRILDLELKDLIDKQISATKISQVQDVTYHQTGTLRTLFDYGDVLIQTASSHDNFHVYSCPKPEIVVRIVGELLGKNQEEGGENNEHE